MMEHRARQKYTAAAPFFRWMFNACEKARAHADQWPPHIYVPLEAAMEELPAALQEMGGRQALEEFAVLGIDEAMLTVASGLTWASWRMGQGIYRFDPELYPLLINTEGNADIPASMLMQLPEWCVYIDTPGLKIPSLRLGVSDIELHGAWLRLDVDNTPGGGPMLVISADTDLAETATPPTQIVYLGGTVADGIRASIQRAQPAVKKDGYSPEESTSRLRKWIEPIVNLALYLCTNPDFSRNGRTATPENPTPKKTKRGVKIFAADGPAMWDVGVRIGSALRAAYQREQAGGAAAGDGHQVRPHMRRAHWHTIISGKRKAPDGSNIPAEKRQRELRWMPPIAVNVDDIDAMPAVVKKVTGAPKI